MIRQIRQEIQANYANWTGEISLKKPTGLFRWVSFESQSKQKSEQKSKQKLAQTGT